MCPFTVERCVSGAGYPVPVAAQKWSSSPEAVL